MWLTEEGLVLVLPELCRLQRLPGLQCEPAVCLWQLR